MKWIIKNKKGLILGFIFGTVIAPFLAALGLAISFFEILRPLLIGPMDFVGNLIPNIQIAPNTYYEILRPPLIGPMDFVGNLIPNIQIAPNTYYAPAYKWILTLGANGIFYAIIGGIIQSTIQPLKEKSKLPKN